MRAGMNPVKATKRVATPAAKIPVLKSQRITKNKTGNGQKKLKKKPNNGR